MAKFVPDPDEQVLKKGRIPTLQGRGKVKFPVFADFVLTDRRLVCFDVGRWAPIHSQGILWQLIVKGTPVSLPHGETILTRGRYALNRNILLASAPAGTQFMLDGFDRTLKMLREALENAGLGMVQQGEETWTIQGR